MADAKLISEIAVYAIIFIISSGIPIYLFIKSKVTVPFFCSLASLGFTLLLVFIYTVVPLPKGKTGELYEVFWLMPPVFVGIVTFILSKTKMKAKQS